MWINLSTKGNGISASIGSEMDMGTQREIALS